MQEGELKVDAEICANPVMTFPIKKIINTVLFIHGTATRYILRNRSGMINIFIPNRLPCFHSPAWAQPPLRGPIFFLIRSLLFLLYLKPLFPINKQFSIDSFLDWEGLHWDFCSLPSFLKRSQFPPSL